MTPGARRCPIVFVPRLPPALRPPARPRGLGELGRRPAGFALCFVGNTSGVVSYHNGLVLGEEHGAGDLTVLNPERER